MEVKTKVARTPETRTKYWDWDTPLHLAFSMIFLYFLFQKLQILESWSILELLLTRVFFNPKCGGAGETHQPNKFQGWQVMAFLPTTRCTGFIMLDLLLDKLIDMGVSKNRDSPKWMVKIMEHPIKMDDLGVFPLFLETPICTIKRDTYCTLNFVFLLAFCRLHLCQGSTTGSQELIATAPLWTTKTDRYLSCRDTQLW